MRPWSKLTENACGSATRCRNTLRGCCPGRSKRILARRAAHDDDGAGAGGCAVGVHELQVAHSTIFLESRLPVNASPASFMRVRRARWVRERPPFPIRRVLLFSQAHTSVSPWVRALRFACAHGSRLASGPCLHCTNIAFNQKTTHDNKFVSGSLVRQR